MTEKELFKVRLGLVRAFLHQGRYDGVLLSRADNFAAATGGRRGYVWTASDIGAVSLFVTREGEAFYVGSNIEERRMKEEELAGLDVKYRSFPWFKSNAAAVVRKEFRGKLVSDDGTLGKNVHNDLAYVRSLLTPVEMNKYRRLGNLAAEAMTAAAKAVAPGMAEADIAAAIIAEGAKRRCQVPVALVAADGRIARHRHPLPTERALAGRGMAEVKVRGYVMLVGCFLREGLVASITRFRQVGKVPRDIPDRHARVCAVDAVMQESSVPGKTLGEVFAACQRAYAGMGFDANEWHNHHQGGTTGYAGRTCKASPGEKFPILDEQWARSVRELTGIAVEFGQAFAWNPSGPGVKSEDTFILWPNGKQEIVTATPEFPPVDLESVLGRRTKVVKFGILAR